MLFTVDLDDRFIKDDLPGGTAISRFEVSLFHPVMTVE